MPVQMVFGCDIILNNPSIADWEAITRRKKQLIDKNNMNKNKNHKPYIYRVSDKLLLHVKKANIY